MSTETFDLTTEKSAQQLAPARAVRKMGLLRSIFMFIFGWMWRERDLRPIEGRAVPKTLPEAAAPPRTLDPAIVARGMELLKLVLRHPETGCGQLRCTVVQDLRVFMGNKGITPGDLKTDLSALKTALRRVPIAHARGYMERALRGEFDRFSTARIDGMMRDDRLTAQDLKTTVQQIDQVRRAESINTCMVYLNGLRSGSNSLKALRDVMRRHNVTAKDLKTTDQEFELYD